MSEKNFNRFLDAIKSNDLAAVEADYLPEFLDKSESGGMYPVHFACSKKSFEVFKFLMKNKCNIESVDNKGHRPIHYAIESGAEEIVKLLIGSLCDLSDYNDLLKMAEKLSERSTEIKEILEKSNENRKTGVEMELDCNVDCNHKFCLISFTLNEFSKEHFLETGSFSKVFKVVESRKNRVFAVKKIILRDVENTKLIENNINNFMKKLDNKHIVKYFGSLRESYKMFIFMEYLPGGSISNLIRTEFPDGLHHDKIIKYSQHILQGLDYLHKSLIIHRDVKPANILLDENDDCKLIDFGLSRLIESGYPSTFCGTLYYMSPEIINEEPYSCTSDIWSVGATVVEMLTGKPPYSDLSQIQIIFKIVQEKKITYKAKNPPSETLSRFIAKLLSPLPSDRGTADELLKSDIFSKNVKK